jgi:16S rRNA C967 or C1407 C5-methylase (RsmB/RsmF family)
MAEIPESLEARLVEHYGRALTDEIIAGMSTPRHTSLRANTLKTTAADVVSTLDAAGIEWAHPAFSQNAFILNTECAAAIRTLPIYDAGQIYLQSLSAMLPPLVLAPRAGETVLDMAAAPGGKTCQMAALSGNQALITACEKNPIRAQKLEHNLDKQGARRVNVMQTDARKLDSFFVFDKVLLDSPCSGSGTLQLAPGAIVDFTDELLHRSMTAQRALLRKALNVVRPGGIVVYSTCSILPEENELAVRDALDPAYNLPQPKGGRSGKGKRGRGRAGKAQAGAQAGPQAPKFATEIVPISAELTRGVPTLPCSLEGAMCVKPTAQYEGFFVCAIKRV